MPRPNKPWFRTSKGTWYARVNGRMTSLGIRGRENRRAAYEAWHKLMCGAQPAAPEVIPPDPSVPQPVQAAGLTAQELADRFLTDARSRLKLSTLNWYERTLTGLANTFGPRPAAAVTPDELQAWLLRTGWGDTTRNHVVGILRVAYRWAERRRLISDDPTRFLTKPPKRSRGAEAVLSAGDHERLMAAAAPTLRPVLAVLYGTGARPSEVAAITAENFDPAAACVRLTEHKAARHGRPRIVYLTPDLVKLLGEKKEAHRSGPLLRNARGNPWTKDAIVLAFRRLRSRTGVRATAYHYRHTAATDLLAAGVPDAHVAELLGHSGTAMLTRHYAHLGSRSRVLHEALNRAR